MLDMLIQLLGAIAVYGLVFIVLFAIVEFIPILKLFPKVKYMVPFCIGTTLFSSLLSTLLPALGRLVTSLSSWCVA